MQTGSPPLPPSDATDLRWHVAHTKPRCEKKFAALLTAEGFAHELPLGKVQRRYGVRIRVHTKPIFPGYVFIQVPETARARCYQQNLIVRLIPVSDEKTFLTQLEAVRRIVASGLETAVRPLFPKGQLVQVVSGPLRGMQGVVDDPNRPGGVIIMIDALQQGLLVKIPAVDLRLM
ncbi:antitermination protein NusG [Verrucomicrobia bacterium IMCC26134]|jgi:transcription antitermination factor NusG|nr:antitermination protein NusG [Verrucomicrobia bacterium IMCC26134]